MKNLDLIAKNLRMLELDVFLAKRDLNEGNLDQLRRYLDTAVRSELDQAITRIDREFAKARKATAA